MAFIDALSHPLGLNVVQLCLIIYFLGFTPGTSASRLYLGLPLIAGIAIYNTSICFQRTGSPAAGSTLGTFPNSFLLHYIDNALVGKWDLSVGGPMRILGSRVVYAGTTLTKPDHNGSAAPKQANSKSRRSKKRPRPVHFANASIWQKFKFGCKAFVDHRGVNELWEARNTPPWSETDPEYVPTRSRFLAVALFKFALCYLTLDVMTASPLENPEVVLAPRRIGILNRLSEVTAEEIIFRFITIIATCIGVMAGITLLHQFIAIVTVAVGLYEPKDWRPIFNNVSEAYTVGRFWGRFFHQMNRRRLASIATVVVQDTLGLPRRSVFGRYVFAFIVFLASGLVHMAQNVSEGMPWKFHGAVDFFLMQFAAIAVEGFVGWATGLRGRNPSWWLKGLGFTWVLCYMTLTAPYWMYPAMLWQNKFDHNQMLPFSVVGMLTAA